jgi:hypothetical protein
MLNTPATYSWYVAGLVFQWVKRQGGLAAMQALNRAKSELLYGTIDASGFYRNPVAVHCRSWMNVPFTLPSADLDKPFSEGARKAGLVSLEGHRSVGYARVDLQRDALAECRLVDFMKNSGLTVNRRHAFRSRAEQHLHGLSDCRGSLQIASDQTPTMWCVRRRPRTKQQRGRRCASAGTNIPVARLSQRGIPV